MRSKRTASRPSIPMMGQSLSNTQQSVSEPRNHAKIRMAGKLNPAIAIPLTILIGGLLLGLFSISQSGNPRRTETPTTSRMAPGESTKNEIAQGSGWLSEVLVTSIVQIVLVEGSIECAVGSGTVIGNGLHVLTNYHVIESDETCRVDRISVRTSKTASSQAVESFSGQVIATSETADLAIIKLTPLRNDVPLLVPLKATVTDEIGKELTIVGYPAIGGDSATVSRGILAGYANIDGAQWIKTDATISGGNSGGAALDEMGNLIGIPTMFSQSTVGEIVDCRNAADTNGDGRVDERDQCVSIGGAIGLIAPVAAFIDLVRDAGLYLEMAN